MRDSGQLPIIIMNIIHMLKKAFGSGGNDLYHNLHTFRMTGGEPLLSKDVWKVLDYIETTDDPNRMLKLSINTNLGAEDRLIDKLIKKINRIRG